MTPSPDHTRPATRRARRERSRARSERAGDSIAALPAFGESLGPELAASRDAGPRRAGFTTPRSTPADADPGRAPEDARTSPVVAAPLIEWADASRPPTALTWIDTATLLDEPLPTSRPREIFDGARLTPEWRRPRLLVPLAVITALCGSYVSSTLLWPLTEVSPVAESSAVEIAPAPKATIAWPVEGSAAVGIQGMTPVASTTTASEIASISKVVSVMMVLERLPLQIGEQGPSFAFTAADARDYWRYRNTNQSSLDVPVGGGLTEYQMLQGILLGSANNYTDRLARELWGTEAAFAAASARWLSDHGIRDVTIASPSGFSEQNVAPPAALIRIGEIAMAHPVFAEIVATRSAEIPGVGVVTNTNMMLDDPGVIGVKTGTLKRWNLLTAKEVTVEGKTVRLFTSVLGQDDNSTRLAVTRQLLADVEKDLSAQPTSVPAGTVVGQVSTEWGDRVDIVTDADAHVLLWNGAQATGSTTLSFGDETGAGEVVGTLAVEGPLGTAETTVSLGAELSHPSAWWRLTHPLELFGLDKR